MKLAIVLSHPTQYYSPWFRWVRQHTELRFRVFYLWDFGVTSQRDRQFQTSFQWDIDLLSGYDSEFVPNTAADPGTHHFRGLNNPDLTDRLVAWQPDAVLLFGYKWLSHARVILWARRRGIPLLFRGDSHFLGRGRPSAMQRLVLGTVYRQFAAFLPVGVANRAYFAALGVPASRQHFAPHSVDASRFDPATESHRAAAAALRASLALPAGTRVLLFAGKLLPAKQPRALLDAFVAARLPDVALVFVGDGPEKTALEAAASGAQAADRVRFLPFANQSEMPSRYLLADVFILPSRGHYETWGLAVNEAMHMGVPAVVSDLVGCQQDLVTESETGWVFAASSPSSLVATLQRAFAVVAIPAEFDRIRTNVAARIGRYTFAATTSGLQDALASLGCERPAPHLT